MAKFVLIQTSVRSIYVDPMRVAAIDASLPQRDPYQKGRWYSEVDLILDGGESIRLWIDGADPDFVLQKLEELVSLIFPLREGTSVILQ